MRYLHGCGWWWGVTRVDGDLVSLPVIDWFGTVGRPRPYYGFKTIETGAIGPLTIRKGPRARSGSRGPFARVGICNSWRAP